MQFSDILALNARSEVAMGMLSDGCTALAWKTDKFSVAGQNWDVSNPANEAVKPERHSHQNI